MFCIFITFHVILAADALSLHRLRQLMLFILWHLSAQSLLDGSPRYTYSQFTTLLGAHLQFYFHVCIIYPVFIFVKRNVSFKTLFNVYITSA